MHQLPQEPGTSTELVGPSGASVSLSTEKSFDSDNVSPPMTHRGDKLRDQVRAQLVPPLSAGHLENLRDLRDQSPEKSSEKPEPEKQEEPSGLDLHLVRRFRSQTDLGDARDARDAPRTEMDHLRSLSESKPRHGSAGSASSGSPVSRQPSRRWPEELVSPRVNEIPKRISATQLLQSPNQQQQMQPGQPGPFPQAVVESKTELSLNGDTLDLLMAPGDVLLMRGSGRISDIGNAGGFMGHVLVVTATPQMVRANTTDALQLSSVWPQEAKALWRVGTVESTRRESGLYECESLLFVDRSRQLLLIGEVEKEGDVCNFEPHEVVEIWQSPEAFRGTLRLDLMGTVLQDMRKNQASWSATTAARAVLQSADISTSRSNTETLEEIKSCWERAPICTSIVITFWQRYLEKFAGCMAIPPPDLRPEARFAAKQDVSYWNSSVGGWEKAVVVEQVMEGNQLLSYNLDVKKGVSPHEVRRRFDDEAVAKKAVDLIRKVVPLKADRSLPGVLMKTMKGCNWSCISQVPQVFRPVVKLTQQMLVPMVPGGVPGQNPRATPNGSPTGPQPQQAPPPGQPPNGSPTGPQPQQAPPPGQPPNGSPTGPQPQQGPLQPQQGPPQPQQPPQPQPGPTPQSPSISPIGTPPNGSPTSTPPGSLPPPMYGHTRSQSPPPMPRHRSNGPNGPGQMLPVYATRPAPPNGPVPVYAMPQPAPQAPMEPQVSEPDSASGATPAEAPQMVEPRPAEPEVFSRQRSQSGLSVEILQELGNNARLEIQKMENTDTEKNLKKASLKPSAFRFWHVLEKITDAMETVETTNGLHELLFEAPRKRGGIYKTKGISHGSRGSHCNLQWKVRC